MFNKRVPLNVLVSNLRHKEDPAKRGPGQRGPHLVAWLLVRTLYRGVLARAYAGARCVVMPGEHETFDLRELAS